MTYREYYKAKRLIRKNKRTNLQLEQKVDLTNHQVYKNKMNALELKQRDKANRKIKRDELLTKLKLKRSK